MVAVTDRRRVLTRQSIDQSSLRAHLLAAGRWCTESQRRVVQLAASLDDSGEWALDGAATCAHWIASALDVEVSTAREWIRIGRALRNAPAIDEAFGAHRLSYSKVRVLSRVVTPEREAEMCELAERTPAGHLARALAALLASSETPAETEHRQHQARSFSWRTEPDGMVAGWFRLEPLAAARLTNAVDLWVLRNPPKAESAALGGIHAPADAWIPPSVTAWPTMAQQRADGLAALAVRPATADGAASGPTSEIVMHVRGDGCTLDDGTPIAGSVLERIAPDSFLRVLIHDAESRPINASGKRRHPSVRQQRVVRERDRGCVECGGTEFLEYDHEPSYETSGRTVVDELRMRCRTCHRARHAQEDAA